LIQNPDNLEYCIDARNLSKMYGALRAVNSISFKVNKGVCFGILGPNGAGKTSLLEMIEGISPITSGEIRINGLDLNKDKILIQQAMSVQLQENNYFGHVSIERLLRFFIEMYANSKTNAAELLTRLGLYDKRKSKYVELSGGQKQRFSVAVALVNESDILFFDEPTSGLDPQNRRFIWDIVQDLKKKGKSIILTTHYMEEADILCDEIVIMDHGRIIARGTSDELKKMIPGKESITVSFKNDERFSAEQLLGQGIHKILRIKPRTLKIWVDEIVTGIKRILDLAYEEGAVIGHMDIDTVTLEDVFIYLTGRELRE
jgi:ABC-type multidrug transport system ATPase subunit